MEPQHTHSTGNTQAPKPKLKSKPNPAPHDSGQALSPTADDVLTNRNVLQKYYRLIMGELPKLLPIAYLCMIGIGMIFNYYKYDHFGINIFQYASVFDFLIAPFEDYIIILFTLVSVLLSCAIYAADCWLENRFPKIYQRMSFSSKKGQYVVLRFYLFIFIVFCYTWIMAMGYGRYAYQEVLGQEDIEVVYYNNDTAKGKQIGKTNDVLFLFDTQETTKAIPLNTSVKEIRYNTYRR